MSNIEVELRSLLSSAERDRVLKRMQEMGSVLQIIRVMVDYSGENRVRTVTLRINNGVRELVAKSGGLADNARQEAVIPLGADVPIEECLRYLYLMGYSDAMVSLRGMYVIKTPEFEYSVRDVLGLGTKDVYSTLFDLEVMNSSGETQAEDLARADRELRSLGLIPLDADGWTAWVHDVYERVDKRFHYSEVSARKLASLLRELQASAK